MHTPEQAWRVILRHTSPWPCVRSGLADALNHVLGESVRADRDMPPAARSAMDGYAVRAADLAACPVLLQLVGEVAAGSPSRPRVRSGTCVRILTGANVPPGADSVVAVEETAEVGGAVKVLSSVDRGANIRRRGEEARRGRVLIRKGEVLDASRIGLCASVGRPALRVCRRPRVTVLCTGAELRLPDEPRLRAHELRNANGPALCAALSRWQDEGVTYGSLPDHVGKLTAALERAVRRYDVVLVTGGMSVGRYDLARQAIEKLGAVVRVHGVAMKPGKPFLYATLDGDRHIFGLPGNPLSALAAFHEFVLPALRRLSGVHPRQCRPSLRLPLSSALTSKGGRVLCVLGRLCVTATGTSMVPIASRSSADLAAAGRADGVILVPPGVTSLAAGDVAEFRPWRPLP